uniref:Uncharacterized protein n=1 Tax=Oryza meridionalis TaxID=40149 RepID=A0A0E0FDW5_9ORYZ
MSALPISSLSPNHDRWRRQVRRGGAGRGLLPPPRRLCSGFVDMGRHVGEGYQRWGRQRCGSAPASAAYLGTTLVGREHHVGVGYQRWGR